MGAPVVTDEEMLVACVQVDARGALAERRNEAWRRLKREYGEVIRRALWQSLCATDREQDVDDAVQDVWLALMRDECRLLVEFDAEDGDLGEYLKAVARQVAHI
jgi:hypothetical protein